MEGIKLVHQIVFNFEGQEYLVEVYCRQDGRHFAQTQFNSQDVIICDGLNLEDVLLKHRELLPLAINSRKMLSSKRPTCSS